MAIRRAMKTNSMKDKSQKARKLLSGALVAAAGSFVDSGSVRAQDLSYPASGLTYPQLVTPSSATPFIPPQNTNTFAPSTPANFSIPSNTTSVTKKSMLLRSVGIRFIGPSSPLSNIELASHQEPSTNGETNTSVTHATQQPSQETDANPFCEIGTGTTQYQTSFGSAGEFQSAAMVSTPVAPLPIPELANQNQKPAESNPPALRIAIPALPASNSQLAPLSNPASPLPTSPDLAPTNAVAAIQAPSKPATKLTNRAPSVVKPPAFKLVPQADQTASNAGSPIDSAQKPVPSVVETVAPTLLPVTPVSIGLSDATKAIAQSVRDGLSDAILTSKSENKGDLAGQHKSFHTNQLDQSQASSNPMQFGDPSSHHSVAPASIALPVVYAAPPSVEYQNNSVSQKSSFATSSQKNTVGRTAQHFTPVVGTTPTNPSNITCDCRNALAIPFHKAVRSVKVANESVCKAFVQKANMLTLVGINAGTTTLTVTYESEQGKAPETTSLTVEVQEPWGERTNEKLTIDSVASTLVQMYPRSSVSLKLHPDGSIVVTGKAESNEVAKQIMLLVRKMFLVPIHDRISVSGS